MERYRGSNIVHGFSKAELFVIVLAVLVVGLFIVPKGLVLIGDIKLENAVDSASSYKDSVNKFFVSRLIVDSNFNYDGVYTISDGKLVLGDTVYSIMKGANVPTGGYLEYQNNVLVDGCIDVNGYSVVVSNGEVIRAERGECGI